MTTPVHPWQCNVYVFVVRVCVEVVPWYAVGDAEVLEEQGQLLPQGLVLGAQPSPTGHVVLLLQRLDHISCQ